MKTKITKPELILLAAAILTVLIYWFAFVQRVNLLDLYQRARLDGSHDFWKDPAFRKHMILAFAAQGFFYWLGWRAARKARGRLAWGIVLGGALISGAILLLLAPFDAADIYDNILHGRILGVYRANPFVQTGLSFPKDTFFPYMAWKWAPSAYGPLWEILAGITAKAAGNGIIANVLAFKLLPGLFLAGSAGLVAAILRRVAPERALAGVLFLAWNPLVLYETLGNGHNDMAMVFWILAAAWCLLQRRYSLAILALVAGALIKFIPLLLIPAAGFVALRDLPDRRSRLRFLILSGAASLAIAILLYLPFWHGAATLSITRRERLLSGSIPAAIYHVLQPDLGANHSASLVSKVAAALTLLFAFWQGWRARQDRTWLSFSCAAFAILTFYLLLTCLWFQQWYTLWPLGIAALLPAGHLSRLAVVFAYSVLSKQFIVGPALFAKRPFQPQPGLEIHFAIGVLGVTWLYAVLVLLSTHSLIRKKLSEIQACLALRIPSFPLPTSWMLK